MVTVADIARDLNIPPTTAREYVHRFKNYFPTKQVAGKRFAQHLDIAKDILKDIIEGYKNGQGTDEIEEVLHGKYPEIIQVDDDKTQQPQTDNNKVTATTSVSALDIVAGFQVRQFQMLENQQNLLIKQTELMQKMFELLENKNKANNRRKVGVVSKRSKNAFRGKLQPHTRHGNRVVTTTPKKVTIVKKKVVKKGLLQRLFS